MKKQITIIEDSNVQTAMISILLSDMEVEISLANNIVDFYRIPKNSPDLIILDDNLRLGFNNQLYHTLKANALTKNIPVILMTDEDCQASGKLSANNDVIILKPFQSEQLIRKIDGVFSAA